jgi:hypothetical protein
MRAVSEAPRGIDATDRITSVRSASCPIKVTVPTWPEFASALIPSFTPSPVSSGSICALASETGPIA